MQLDLPDVNYEYFDFHGECKNMRWDRISVLIDRMKEDLDKYASVTSFPLSCLPCVLFSSFVCSYFHLDSASEPKKLQHGITRTNCMDNLDRTNVVQAAMAKYTLNTQLRHLGIFSEGDDVDSFETLSKDFRESMYPICLLLANTFTTVMCSVG